MKTYVIKIPQENSRNAAAFEEVFNQLHETLRNDIVSFEMYATGQNTAFCFTAQEDTAEVVAGQIYAIAADCDIVQIPDFMQSVRPEARFLASELSLAKNDLYPLNDYRTMEGDSLSGLLSVISKCAPGEGVFVQVVFHPVRDSSFHNAALWLRKKINRLMHVFRVKYWFKKNVDSSIFEKITEKTGARLFHTNIRVAALSVNQQIDPANRLNAICGAMSNFNTVDYNQVRIGRFRKDKGALRSFQDRQLKNWFMLSAKELSTIFHLPRENEVPNLVRVLSKRQAPPTNLPTDIDSREISFFGQTNFRNQKVPFGLKRADRRRHLYVLGKSGSGKSKLLELLIREDIESGKGVGILDPHGDLVDNILKIIPKHRMKDVVLFDPSDLEHPPAFNPLEQVPEALKMRVTIGFIEIFKKLFGTNWSPRLEHVLRYTTLALLDSKGTTVLSILKMLTDKNYRQKIVRNIQDNVVKNFWVNEFAGWSEKFDNEAITPLLNKVGQFVATNMIRNIVGQPENLIDFRNIMDNKKILLMKVSKGILGEENASLLGAMAVTKIYQAAMSRADTPEQDRVDFYFYVDEFHNFATDTFDEILSEARKYRLNLTLANQFLGQLSDKIRKTVFGNVGSLISFRVGGEDASILAAEYNPRFSAKDIINLGVRDFIIKMSIDGELEDAFSGRTLNMEAPAENFAQDCINYSRAHYARPVTEVTDILKRWEEGTADGPAKGGAAPRPAAVQAMAPPQQPVAQPQVAVSPAAGRVVPPGSLTGGKPIVAPAPIAAQQPRQVQSAVPPPPPQPIAPPAPPPPQVSSPFDDEVTFEEPII
jgi:hypothetical protein